MPDVVWPTKRLVAPRFEPHYALLWATLPRLKPLSSRQSMNRGSYSGVGEAAAQVAAKFQVDDNELRGGTNGAIARRTGNVSTRAPRDSDELTAHG